MVQSQDPRERRRQQIADEQDRNVYVAMHYGEGPAYEELEATIEDTLLRFSLKPLIAKKMDLALGMWENMHFCMTHSNHAIVVFENIDGKAIHNPNVSLELGYLLALGRIPLILKERSLHDVPTDVRAFTFRDFEASRIRQTITARIERWIDNVVDRQSLRRSEVIVIDDVRSPLQHSGRIEKIIEQFQRLVNSGERTEIRLAGTLTSLAVSEKASQLSRLPAGILDLERRERDLLLTLLAQGCRVSAIVSPQLYANRVRDDARLIDEAIFRYLPRYEALVEMIASHIDDSNLRVVWSEHLPRQSLIVCGQHMAFVGTRTTHEHRSRTTIVNDRAVVDHEIAAFDYAFEDTVEQFRKDNPQVGGEEADIIRSLKKSVIKKVGKAGEKLQQVVDKHRREMA